MPRFSIVVPTLQRPDTLRHALATAVAQSYEDVEIIVQNNGRDPATKALVEELGDTRIRHFWSSSVLTITENWEAALANANGDLITFIGDDDGLFPDACRTAAEIFDRTNVEIVSWLPFCYYWPKYANAELSNRLVALVDYSPEVQVIQSENLLRRFYRFATHYSQLPMIYNSFVRRQVIERVTNEIGRYFIGFSPDVTSGIGNAAHCARFARLSIPLSMTGISHHSTGHNAFRGPRGSASPAAIKRDFETVRLDERLVQSDNLEIFIAHDMLLVQDRVSSIRDRITFDFYRLIQSVAAAINDRPDTYQDTLVAIRRLAERHNIDLARIAIPELVVKRQAPPFGNARIGPGRELFTIDGSTVPLATVADAIGWMGQIMPPVNGATIEIRNSSSADHASARLGETLAFGSGGNGVPALADGWGQPEEWGTWSVAKCASLRFSVEGADRNAIRAELRYRAFLSPSYPRLSITCRVAGQEVLTWNCTNASPSQVQQLIIPADPVRAEEAVELEFVIPELHSPAELGLSTDTRLLGIGIESIKFAKQRR